MVGSKESRGVLGLSLVIGVPLDAFFFTPTLAGGICRDFSHGDKSRSVSLAGCLENAIHNGGPADVAYVALLTYGGGGIPCPRTKDQGFGRLTGKGGDQFVVAIAQGRFAGLFLFVFAQLNDDQVRLEGFDLVEGGETFGHGSRLAAGMKKDFDGAVRLGSLDKPGESVGVIFFLAAGGHARDVIPFHALSGVVVAAMSGDAVADEQDTVGVGVLDFRFLLWGVQLALLLCG